MRAWSPSLSLRLLITVQDSVLLMCNEAIPDVQRVANEERMENSDDEVREVSGSH